MTRTTITLPDELAVLLAREARRRSTSVSEVVRSAVASHLGVGQQERRLAFVAVGRSGRRDTARNAERILSREWGRAGRR
jgi:predicted transcriptional regulator